VTRALGPQHGLRGGGTSTWFAPWLVPGVAAAALAASAALWAGGALATRASRAAARLPAFSPWLAVRAARGGTRALWPGVDPALVWGAAAGLLLVLLASPAVLLARWWARLPAADDPLRSLARPSDLPELHGRGAAGRALRLRPSLRAEAVNKRPRPPGGGDVGVALGRLLPRGPVLRAGWEDVALAFMAPRSGKSTALAVPAVLDAPGAVVATSNKNDVWAATAAPRARDTGQAVWTFDPQAVAHVPQTWWWDPLRGLHTVEEAERLAGHFVLTVDDERSRDIWGPAAQELLAALLLAARASGGSLHDVYAWLSDETSPAPAETLRAAGYPGIAASLAGTQGSPPETRGSVYFTARVAARCLRNPQITAWVTPPDTTPTRRGGPVLAEFDAESFPASRQTLYLLSKDGGGSAAPLVAALTDRVLRTATAAAERRGGRLDPPLLVALDEAANICRIADLPQLYSHLGSRGILPLTILQSWAQGVAVWGETGMRALLSAATVKVVGAGTDDPGFAEDLSRLIGDHDVPVVSLSTGDGRTSRSISLRSQRILPASALRALPKGRALLWLTGARVAMVELLPWYAGPRRAEVAAAVVDAEAQLRARAADSAPAPPGRPAPVGGPAGLLAGAR